MPHVDYDAVEAEVSVLLTVLQDRQPGMRAFHQLVAEHIVRINKIAALRQTGHCRLSNGRT
jgi:hypothetical protein